MPRVALVHDWLTGTRGGEKVLQRLLGLLPGAELFTLVHVPGSCTADIERRPIHTSWLSDLPGVRRGYRHLLGLMLPAAERMSVEQFDLIVSSSHCAAKGIGGRRDGQVHVCYCHTPMRYAWEAADDYARQLGPAGLALRAAGPFLRAWDRRTAGRVDRFVANSACVAGRIARAYGREAAVVHPPVDVGFYTPADVPREAFYLMVTALAPYKRVAMAMEAFAQLSRPLKVIGTGPPLGVLRRAAPRNVELLGWCDADTVRDHYRRCRAVIFPQREDFGIVPVEAMACGAPVIAYGEGGALETVRDAGAPHEREPTGLWFHPQTPEALAAAVERFDGMVDRIDPIALRRQAERFSPARFDEGFRAVVAPLLDERGWVLPWEGC
ncbi:MAG: glycosyltransferase [Phycisphaerae bacterium]|nr:glycosyltransferase [Phycisphaerae bacterium]